MKIKGKAFVVGDNVNTDEIIPARYLNTHDPSVLAKYCMEDCCPGFGQREDIGELILVAGENFGCGSSREHAPLSIKSSGISCVVAKSFARIFLRNSFNIGLPLLELPQTHEIKQDDRLILDFIQGEVFDVTAQKRWNIQSYPMFLQEIFKFGGWLEYAREKLVKGKEK